jgi:hypothetical protein
MARNRQDMEHGRMTRDTPSERERVKVAQHETGDDLPLLSALLGGLALALVANTFIGLIPG